MSNQSDKTRRMDTLTEDSGIEENIEAAKPDEAAGPDEPAEAAEDSGFSLEDAEAERRPHPKKNRKHRKKNRILRLLIVVAAIAALFAVAHLPAFQITEIPVIGNKTVTDKEILKLSGIHKGDSIFLLNPWGVSHKIKKNLYIEDAKLQRDLPGTVEIIVREREASAQFAMTSKDNKTSYVVTDSQGMVMGISDKRQKVTIIDDVVVAKATEGDEIRIKETDVYHKAMDLIAAAKNGDLYFKRIHIKGSLVHAYIYDGLVCKGRYRNIIDSIQSGELKSVVYRLYQEDVEKGTINIGDNNYCSFTPQK